LAKLRVQYCGLVPTNVGGLLSIGYFRDALTQINSYSGVVSCSDHFRCPPFHADDAWMNVSQLENEWLFTVDSASGTADDRLTTAGTIACNSLGPINQYVASGTPLALATIGSLELTGEIDFCDLRPVTRTNGSGGSGDIENSLSLIPIPQCSMNWYDFVTISDFNTGQFFGSGPGTYNPVDHLVADMMIPTPGVLLHVTPSAFANYTITIVFGSSGSGYTFTGYPLLVSGTATVTSQTSGLSADGSLINLTAVVHASAPEQTVTLQWSGPPGTTYPSVIHTEVFVSIL